MAQRIAIIGGGISGLGAAYLLAPHYAVSLYEASPQPGGHSRTLQIDYAGTKIAVDTGFIVYNERNYPLLTKLFQHLNVITQPSDMSFAASVNHGAEEWSGDLFAHISTLVTPARWPKIAAILKFNRQAEKRIKTQPNLTLGELLVQLKLGTWFEQHYLLPMGAAIWSCPVAQMLTFPAKNFIQFFINHGLLTIFNQPKWRTVAGGSVNYVTKLQAATSALFHTNMPVQKVIRRGDNIQIITANGIEEFEQIVFACPANMALALLGAEATTAEQNALSAFDYQKNTAYLHGDITQMPRNKKCWSSWNYLVDTIDQAQNLALTYWMNRLQHIDRDKPLFVTLNPVIPIADDKIFDVHEFMHPVFTTTAMAAQPLIQAMQGKNRTWFCGAYLGYGFHEDGLRSAVQVAAQLGVQPPW